MRSASVDKAKRFLVQRVLEQAKRDNVPFTEVEVRMLGFAEESASAKDMEAARVFERDYNDEEYESKVAELLRRAYKRDKESGEAAAWDQALAVLGEEDMYLLVMLKRAGIESANPLLDLLDWRLFLGILPACISAAIGIGIAFTSFGAKLIPNEILRLIVLLFMLVAPLLISKIRNRPRLD